MNEFLPVLIVALLSLIIGLIIGLLVASLRGGNAAPSERSDPAEAAPPVQVWLAPGTGRLHIELKEKNVSSPAFLNGEEREQLELFSQQLALWLGQPASPPAPAPVTSVRQPAALEMPVPNEPARAVPGMFDLLRRGSTPAPVVKSIAAQVDEILQARLEELTHAGDPLGKRSIRLKELPGRGLVVVVEGDEYEGVSAVPDQQVRGLLSRCVAEWEAGTGSD